MKKNAIKLFTAFMACSFLFTNIANAQVQNIKKNEVKVFLDNIRTDYQKENISIQLQDKTKLPLLYTIDSLGLIYEPEENTLKIRNQFYELKKDLKANKYTRVNFQTNTNEDITLEQTDFTTSHISIRALKLLGLTVEYKTVKNVDYIYINNAKSKISEFTKEDKEKYKELQTEIDNLKTKANWEKEQITRVIAPENLANKMVIKHGEKSDTLSVSKGYFKQYVGYGALYLLKDGKIIDTGVRTSNEKSVDYELRKSTYEQADEIVIICPLCPLTYLTKIENPFKPCECSGDKTSKYDTVNNIILDTAISIHNSK